jgi:serine protease
LQVTFLLTNIVIEYFNVMRVKVLTFIVGSLFFAGSVFSQVQDTTVIPGSLIVMLHKSEYSKIIETTFSKIQGLPTSLKVESTLSDDMHIFTFHFDADKINSQLLLNVLRMSPLVKLAQFDHKVQLRNTPFEPNFSQQWNMNNTGQYSGTVDADISAVEAWDISTGGLTSTGDTIVVAVIDGGFDLNHQDLSFWKNYNEIPNNNVDDDNNGYKDDFDGWDPATNTDNLSVLDHGTHICGIIGANGANNIGVAGINWSVKIMPIITSGSESNVVKAYSYVYKQRKLYNQTNGVKGAFVVATSSSFGINLAQPSNYPLWCAMYDSLGSVGILNAASTANANYNVDTQGDMPSACNSNWLVTVTNTDNKDQKVTNAGYGATTIDMGAPGANIMSTVPSNKYQAMSGTSMACPHVAGAIALMFSVGCPDFMAEYKANPDSIALIIKDSLLSTVDTLSSLQGITLTGGRLNLNKAVNSILNRYATDSCIIDPIIPRQLEIVEELPLVEPSASDMVNIINVYPNPTNGLLNIDFYNHEDSVLVLMNTLGEIVKSFEVLQTEHSLQIDTRDLNKGVYFLQLKGNSGASKTTKVIIY